MQAFGRKYPHAGGYAANNIEEAKTLTTRVTEVTHNHPEGIKGAQAVAVVNYDIIPTIKEYWFDNEGKVKDWIEKLTKTVE